ncbi:MAG TPA: Holliday junction resolvase RuvX [Anaerolineales bacterium]|nr:Holliday junction resolvase RuvX [Anaerolineales bacterium]
MRILAIDPGEKNIGVAISDPTGTIANPFTVLKHVSRTEDAAAIVEIASHNEVDLIVIGQALSGEGTPTPQSRRAARLAGAIKSQTTIRVCLWDESGSTQTARAARIAMGATRRKRKGHLDELAATVILQDYLDHGAESG